jgi:hypothetical protein
MRYGLIWRLSTWYLTILEDLQPKAGQAQMEKMENFLVRMEKFPVRVEKIIVYSWQNWSCYLSLGEELAGQGLGRGTSLRAGFLEDVLVESDSHSKQ